MFSEVGSIFIHLLGLVFDAFSSLPIDLHISCELFSREGLGLRKHPSHLVPPFLYPQLCLVCLPPTATCCQGPFPASAAAESRPRASACPFQCSPSPRGLSKVDGKAAEHVGRPRLRCWLSHQPQASPWPPSFLFVLWTRCPPLQFLLILSVLS